MQPGALNKPTIILFQYLKTNMKLFALSAAHNHDKALHIDYVLLHTVANQITSVQGMIKKKTEMNAQRLNQWTERTAASDAE